MEKVKMRDWIKNVTNDSRALKWFDSEYGEERIIKAYKQLLDGYNHDPSKILTTTRLVEGNHAGVVIIKNINYYSLCAHHFMPFHGTISIAYIPGKKIIGLGKFPRLVNVYSRRFQIQEDLVKEIAEEIMVSGEAKGVFVISQARHLCISSRGPADDTAETYTTYALGDLGKSEHEISLELLR